ncbi:hypothetical protein MNBD_GAMMA07-2751 [hydrothermal vent metagenome]|uniref:Uncharacterized protein n=1 Tax=hydrothermal vent metagenome TaxID=652676 RepID=A0A3B0X0J2_9ZZZZ
MQYAVMNTPGNAELLIDANELQSFQKAMESDDPGLYMHEEIPNDNTMVYKIVYGVYIPKSNFSRTDVKHHINKSINVWLVHFRKDHCLPMKIEDIIIHEQVFLKSYGQKINTKNEVAFSALIRIPRNITIGSNQTEAVTAFVRYFNEMNPISNLLNRLGIFAFKSEETSLSNTPLSKDNWKDYIHDGVAIRAAQITC